MINPKEKAQELLFQFSHANSCVKSAKNVPVELILMRNKQCALIAVDEIINANGLHPNDTDYDYNKAELYWLEVKKEIEKL